MDCEASAGYSLFPRQRESRNAELKPAAWPSWLGEEPADTPQIKALLAPYPAEEMVAWPVSPRVGNVKNNDPTLIEPIAGAG
jgi:putative SOS response-associated peptidase YedK